MQKNSYVKEAKLEEVMEIYDEFYDYIDDEFSSEELLRAASNFVEIAREKISKENLKDYQGHPTYYSQDTYTSMTIKPWINLYEYYRSHDFCDQYSNNWNRYNQISKGWINA